MDLYQRFHHLQVINEYGFIETPYRKIDPETHRATDIVEYMSADVEDNYIIAQASEPMDENGEFINDRIRVRYRNDIIEVDKNQVQYVDVSPKQLVSIAAAMIHSWNMMMQKDL